MAPYAYKMGKYDPLNSVRGQLWDKYASCAINGSAGTGFEGNHAVKSAALIFPHGFSWKLLSPASRFAISDWQSWRLIS